MKLFNGVFSDETIDLLLSSQFQMKAIEELNLNKNNLNISSFIKIIDILDYRWRFLKLICLKDNAIKGDVQDPNNVKIKVKIEENFNKKNNIITVQLKGNQLKNYSQNIDILYL